MKLKTMVLLGVVIALSGSAADVYARVRWHHESVVYFQVWELGKCGCRSASFSRGNVPTRLPASTSARCHENRESGPKGLSSCREAVRS